MPKSHVSFLVSLLLLIPGAVCSQEQLPSLPDPEFEFMGNNSKDPANDTASAPDLLAELEGLLENPAQRDAKAQLGLDTRSQILEDPSEQHFIDPIPKLKNEASLSEVASLSAKKRGLSSASSSESKRSKNKGKRTPQSFVNHISAIKFSRKEKYHELEIQSEAPLNFKLQTKKKARQLIYTFSGVSIPRNLRRAYDTREFNSPVAMYTLGRLKNRRVSLGQLVIQMRELVLPHVTQEGNILTLQFPDKVERVYDRKIATQLPETSLGRDAFEGGRTFLGQRIEKLELKNTDIAEALKLVLQSSGYNVIISDEVKGEVGNLSLSDTPWDQAFHLLLKMKGLGYVLRGNVLQIAPVAILQQERDLAEKQEETEPLRTVMIPVSYAKAATLAPRAQAFLSQRGKVDTDERTNTIIVRDVDAVIQRIQKVFNVLDTQPPSVSISAKFVEIKKDFSRALGLGQLTLSGQTSGVNFGSPQAPTTDAGFVVNPQGTINLSAPKFAALNATLKIGETDRKVQVLANPTITVQQGQKGSISQGKTTDIPQQSVGQGVVAAALSQSANLSLDVTPIVANDGSISLDTNLLQEIPQNIGNTLQKDTRQIKTQIILKNGDTAVLGGIFSGSESDVNLGLPLLRNLPILSFFFSSQTQVIERNEVLIFITARILNPESAFKQSL